ncbi:uncharacterized protein LOC110929759 [Helianthus annuus]|uniref:uncharacterized protein LOC110929759 n=1 Tax=Helianthus annuus TaxID=4232 RepID=UPI000B8FD064|nr:uncharacterized protein LOC110929759 [Helianthus annuus]
MFCFYMLLFLYELIICTLTKKLHVQFHQTYRGMQAGQFQRPMAAMPEIEDEGNHRFVIFIRMANIRYKGTYYKHLQDGKEDSSRMCLMVGTLLATLFHRVFANNQCYFVVMENKHKVQRIL